MSKSGDGVAGHLAPGVREHLQLGDDARIAMMQRDRWIDYSRAGEVLDRLERLLATPERDRMPCLLLHGERRRSRRPRSQRADHSAQA